VFPVSGEGETSTPLGPCERTNLNQWTTRVKVKVKVKIYVTTDGQSASLSCYKTPIWGLRADRYFCQAVAGLLMWGALSDERMGLSFARVTAVISLLSICMTRTGDLPACSIMPQVVPLLN
jgi:hypothetical protein